MRTLGVGIDLVEVEEVQTALARFGDRYLERVFTPHELACATGEGDGRARQLAARFAAKEAAMKALGLADGSPPWRSIEVRRDQGGRCTLLLTGHAAELADRAGVRELKVNLTRAGSLAAAVVLALGRDTP